MSRFTSRSPLPISGIVDLSVSSGVVKMALDATFDYIIIGGGTAGLVLANRLSKDPKVDVLVLEAGSWQFENQTILNPAFAGGLSGTSLDWNYETVPQPNLGGRKVTATRGKLLGGCSTFNAMMWCRPHGSDFDAWEKLGNKGWGWKSVLPFFMESETFHPPSVTRTSVVEVDGRKQPLPIPFIESAHGEDGPVQTSYSPYISPQFDFIYQAFIDAGIPESVDINAGNPTGVSWVGASIHPETQTRQSSEVAYLNPFRNRKNLLVLTNAHVTNIDWSTLRSRAGSVVAEGVSFKSSVAGKSGPSFSTKVNGEVILSGGTFNTPQLLELSGVGDLRRLKALGIRSVINLPGVGENLQDHPIVAVGFKLTDGDVSLDNFRSDPAFAALAFQEYRKGKGILCQSAPLAAYLTPSQFLSEEDVQYGRSLITDEHEKELANSSNISATQRAAQLEYYDKSPIIEFVFMNGNIMVAKPEPGASYVTCVVALQHALSRGTVHIKSDDPFTAPDIDPEYLSHPADAWFITKGVQFVRKLFKNHLADICVEVAPGYDALPRSASKDDWLKWIGAGLSTEYHPMGTAAALPKNDGGVVGSDLKLWGAENVRVADMSIAPLHLSCHLQTVAYMIGEKASAEIADVMVPSK